MSVTKFTTAPAAGDSGGDNTLLILLGLAVAGAIAWYVMRDKDEEPAPAEEEAK